MTLLLRSANCLPKRRRAECRLMLKRICLIVIVFLVAGCERSIRFATCTAPLHQTVVFWTGELGLCCIDYDRMIRLPSIDRDGFVAAYRSDAAAQARRSGFAKRFAICRSCSYSDADNMGFVVDLRRPTAAPVAA